MNATTGATFEGGMQKICETVRVLGKRILQMSDTSTWLSPNQSRTWANGLWAGPLQLVSDEA